MIAEANLFQHHSYDVILMCSFDMFIIKYNQKL